MLKEAPSHPLEETEKPGAGQSASSSSPVKSVAAVVADPLSTKPEVVVVGAPAGFVDPLSAASSAPFDPLGAGSADSTAAPMLTRAISTASIAKKLETNFGVGPSANTAEKKPEDGLNWTSKKAGILSKYTTTESLSVPYPHFRPNRLTLSKLS